MSQWAEIRHLHFVQKLGKRAIARRLGVDRKTVTRVLGEAAARTGRRSPRRGRRLDAHRPAIIAWLEAEPCLTAKRIGALLRGTHPGLVVRPRALREYVAQAKASLRTREAFVHRTHPPGATLEVDFGQTYLVIAGQLRRGHYLVATLPASNAYFVKIYPFERLECLLDGIVCAFRYFGGLTGRLVLDNTSLAVREVLRGPERDENRAFQAFRGELALHADFCAPRKGWEKGSVEGGVGYARDNCFRPRMEAASWEAANEKILHTLDADLDTRQLPDGRTARQALAEERVLLRPLPIHLPEACRTHPRGIDKFGHVTVDGVRYSVPIEHAYGSAIVRLYHDRVAVAVGADVVASHVRAWKPGANVLDPLHILSLLIRKHRAAGEATALLNLPPVFERLRAALRDETRRSDREWIEVLQLMHHHTLEEVAHAAELAIDKGSPRLATIRALLRREEGPPAPVEPVSIERADIAAIYVKPADLTAYDQLGRAAS